MQTSTSDSIRTPHEIEDSAGIRAIFSVDDSDYLAWQAELLAYSFRRVEQPGSLTRLWSATRAAGPFLGETFQTPPYSPHPVTGDDYVCYNRQFALDDWLRATPVLDETIALIDPDFVYVKPITTVAQAGRPIAHPTGYISPHRFPALVERHCRRPTDIQSIGWPVLISRADLAMLTPLWIAKTEAIRGDAVVREDAGWITDMWGYVFAAAELGLRHDVELLAATQMDNFADVPFIHYCYASTSPSGNWRWEKRWYEPDGPIPEPPDDVPLASKVLVSILNEWLVSRSTGHSSIERNATAGFLRPVVAGQ